LLLFAPLFGGPENGATFNLFVRFMATNPLIKVMEYVLASGFIIHIVYAFIINLKNNAARPVKYAYNKSKDKGSTWFSRNMIWTGIIVLIYLVVHIPMFYGKYHFGHEGNDTMSIKEAYESNVKVKEPIMSSDNVEVLPYGKYIFEKDWALITASGVNVNDEVKVMSMTKLTKDSFSDPLIAGFYALSMLFLAFHLMHGFQSGFRTLGLVHKKYMPLIKAAGFLLAVVVPVLFALMPIAFYFGIV